MKRLLVAFVGLLASVAIAAPVSAGYPPGSPTVESSSGTPAPGASIDIHLTGFCPSSSVVLDIDGTTVGGGATNGSGSVTITIAAPSTAGTHTITATASGDCTDVASLAIVVTAGGGLPTTGSNTTMPGLQIAIVAVLVGGALVGLASMRRRRSAAH